MTAAEYCQILKQNSKISASLRYHYIPRISFLIMPPSLYPVMIQFLLVGKFNITDDMYNDFENYVRQRNFTYTTKSEESLKKLIETARQEKYYDLASSEFSSLELKLTHDNSKDLFHFRDEISSLLKQEIVSRYYYQWGTMEATIENDSEIIESCRSSERSQIILFIASI